MRALEAQKKHEWRELKGRWVPHDLRDNVVDFIRVWSTKTGISLRSFLVWLELSKGKFHAWLGRYGKANEHNALVPRDHWLSEEERQKIIKFFVDHPLNGYRRLAFMMIDADVVYVSPGTVYNVLLGAGLMGAANRKASKKGTGFVQPLKAHDHWHIDISYINLGGTFYYLCAVLDGFSRYIVHWELRESMKEQEIELIIERARAKFPGFSPRIISDNGPQFIAKDFKQYIRISGMTHVRTSPYYPQSNGKLERWHGELKRECIRPAEPRNYEEALKCITHYVDEYNNVRLHSAISYVAPLDKLEGRADAILAARDRKLEQARLARQIARQNAHAALQARMGAGYNDSVLFEDRALLGSNPSASKILGSLVVKGKRGSDEV